MSGGGQGFFQAASWGSLPRRLTELEGVHRGILLFPGSLADMSLSESDSSCFCGPLEETLAAEVRATITQSLSDAAHTLGCSKLILPDCLPRSIGQELLHLAACEPCGLRGALIDLCVDRGDQGPLCAVEQIAVDATLVPTFHLTLVLRLESGGLWPKVQKLFKGSRPPQASAGSPGLWNTQRLSVGFRAIKRKLYSSGELLIEECC
uniref:DNA damage-inducible transcript 4 protein n=1 Tax=Scophthalmus maximus TaxID=52904 RepID=A0A8D2ZF96_SCOMX